ncbi:MAG: hypothetical protein Q4D73_06365 [Actinomycetaceae bacterium]|nr:hypothetical protein [Actinomycetaceae bacterium]
MKQIKQFFENLQREYASTYPGEKLFDDYERSALYVERLGSYLEARLKKQSRDIDAACVLVSVWFELREADQACIAFLQNFQAEHQETLNAADKARLHTNCAFYEAETYACDPELFNAALQLESPYWQTYLGLGLTQFSRYQMTRDAKALALAKAGFLKQKELRGDYLSHLNYAAALFAEADYRGAKEQLYPWLESYPDRPRLLFALAQCEAKLQNPAAARELLSRVKVDEPSGYVLRSDEVSESCVADLYFELGDYGKYLEICREADLVSPWQELSPYLYAVLRSEGELVCQEVAAQLLEELEAERAQLQAECAHAESGADSTAMEELAAELVDIEAQMAATRAALQGVLGAEEVCGPELEFHPEAACYLVDCVRHSL